MISVIVPVYNVEKYIYRCIDSILAQTFTGFELILVDDGSPDNCGNICDEYAEKDNRIHVIHKENGGLSSARNAGLDWIFANSDSEWVTFVDSDDWVLPNYLEVLYKSKDLLDSPQLIVSKHIVSYDENIIVEKPQGVKIIDPDDFRSYYGEYATCAIGKLYRKCLFEIIRYPVGKLNEDVFTTYKLIFSVNKVIFVDAALYIYYHSESSIMRSKWTARRLDALEAFNEQIGFFYNHHYVKSYKRAILAYANTVIDQIKSCEEYGTDDPNAPQMLKKLLREHLRKYKTENIFSITSTPQYYEMAYPCFMKFYWTIKGLVNKINKK